MSIASGAVVLMTKAARVGIVGNESCAGLRLFLIVPANFWRNRNLERHGRIHTAPPGWADTHKTATELNMNTILYL